jgi:hypothetical protein
MSRLSTMTICQICHPPRNWRMRARVAWLILRGREVPGTTVRVYDIYYPEGSLHRSGLGLVVAPGAQSASGAGG